MNQGRTVFAQIMEFVTRNEFNQCVEKHGGNQSVRRLSRDSPASLKSHWAAGSFGAWICGR
jgi:hypothetical protein